MPREPKSDITVWTRPSLFGSIGGVVPPARVDFIPWDKNSNVVDIKDGFAKWLGLATPEMQYWAYCYCSPLASVIDRCAEADINGEVWFSEDGEDAGGNDVKRLKKLFRKPNPTQTWYEFRAQQLVYKKDFGYCPVYDMRPAGMTTKYLWNLNPRFCTPIPRDNYSIITADTDQTPILRWDIQLFGQTYSIPAEKIFLITDSVLDRNLDQLGLPISKVAGLDWAVSNICAAMEADNVLLRKKGPLGFISHDPQRDPIAGYIPMGAEEKTEIQDDLAQYGMSWSQFQYVVTRHGIRWNPMSFNVSELQTKETIRQGIDMICDRFGHPAELMSGKNATYENRTSAERFFYNTSIIPQNRRDMHIYTMYYQEKGELSEKIDIKGWYEDYPALMDAKVAQGESKKYSAEAYHQLFVDKAITMNEYRKLMNIDTVKNEDFYYNSPEYIAKYGEDIASKDSATQKTDSSNPV